MDIKSYVKRSAAGAEIVTSVAVYAGSEVVKLAATNLKRAAAGVSSYVEKASSRGEAIVKARRRQK